MRALINFKCARKAQLRKKRGASTRGSGMLGRPTSKEARLPSCTALLLERGGLAKEEFVGGVPVPGLIGS